MKRTLIKTISYRIISSTQLALLAWLLTGSFDLASKIGGLHVVFSSMTYAGFEHAFESVWSWFTK